MMSRPLVRAAAVASVVSVLAAAVLWTVGPVNTFAKARAAERIRQQYDALGLMQRDVALVQAAHRTLLLIPDARARDEYNALRRQRDVHLDSLGRLSDADGVIRDGIVALRARLSELDAFRDTMAAVSVQSRDSAVALLRSERAANARNNVAAQLAALETEQRLRLAAAQPALERQRTLLTFAIPASLALVGVVLGWLYAMIARESARARRRAAQYRRTLDESPDGVVICADGVVTYANGEAVRMLSADGRSALTGTRLADLVAEHERPAVTKRLRDALAGERLPPKITHFDLGSGMVIEAETRDAPIEWAGSTAVQVTLRDVAERRRQERALQLSEQRFRAVLDTMEEGVVLQDENLAIHLANPAAERILGMSLDQMTGRTSLDPRWMATDDDGDPLPGDRHFTAVALRTGRPASGIMGVRRGDDSRVWLHVNAVPIARDGDASPFAVVGTFTDVTVARETSRRLAQSEALYRLVTENSVDLVTLRAADDRLLYVSPSHARVLGWEPSELEGRPGIEIVHPDDARAMATLDPPLFDAARTGTATVRLRHKAGHYVWVEVISAPISVADGVVTTYAMSARDVTERRQLEDALRQAQKMESMGRMASGVAHDFNNLLTAIRGSADLLRFSDGGPDAIRESVDEITDGVDRAAALTAQLLAFSRGQHSTPQLLDCTRVLQDSAAILQRLVAPKARLVITVAPGGHDARIFADRAQFEQVLFNLVVNARDAVHVGGEISITLGMQELSEELQAQTGKIRAGRYAVLTVRDDGSGIPEAVMPHLFEPFYTTKPQGEGTGLGLATVYGIVKQHHGGIAVASTAGSGAAFTVFMPHHESADDGPTPVAEAPGGAPEPIAAPALHRTRSGTASILLVDDEAPVRRTVARILARQGMAVIEAADANEALAIVADPAVHVDAVITDVRMPGMTGVQMVERMFASRVDLPVLFISGQMDDPIPRNWASTLPKTFLRKPFRSEELSREVRRLLGVA